MMDKQLAIQAMCHGHKVTHNNFKSGEWMQKVGEFYELQDGSQFEIEGFWESRIGGWWENGWDYYDSKSVFSRSVMKRIDSQAPIESTVYDECKSIQLAGGMSIALLGEIRRLCKPTTNNLSIDTKLVVKQIRKEILEALAADSYGHREECLQAALALTE